MPVSVSLQKESARVELWGKDGSDARLLYLEISYVQHREPAVTQVTRGCDNQSPAEPYAPRRYP
jgi:hypothetical protein